MSCQDSVQIHHNDRSHLSHDEHSVLSRTLLTVSPCLSNRIAFDAEHDSMMMPRRKENELNEFVLNSDYSTLVACWESKSKCGENYFPDVLARFFFVDFAALFVTVRDVSSVALESSNTFKPSL